MNTAKKGIRVSPQYDDIIRLPHPDSPTHPRMPSGSRAAQFAPFAALTGHDAAIRETARLTDERIALDEGEQAALDRRLQLLRRHLDEQPAVLLTYFQPDVRKSGGAYRTAAGSVKKMNAHAGLLLLQDGTRIPIAEIIRVEGPLFRDGEAPV